MKPRLLLSALLGIACAGHTAPARPGAERCPGEWLVTVTNDWSGAVDIYARLEGTDTPRALGVVQAGAHADFVAPAGTREVYAIQAGLEVGNALTRSVRRYVRFRFSCR